MKRFLPFLIIAVVALLAVGAGVMLYRAKREVVFPPIPGEIAESQPGAKPPHFRGAPQATVVVEEFADLQCPPCAALSKLLKKLEDDYAGRVRIVFRQFPLEMHKFAEPAAYAAEAAAVQGKFWEMADELYQNQIAWSKADNVAPLFEEYAQKIGVNIERFRADLAQRDKLQTRIEADKARGKAMAVVGTPTIFLNNQRVPQQSMNEIAIRAAIDSLLKGEPAFPSTSPTPAAPTPASAPSTAPSAAASATADPSP